MLISNLLNLISFLKRNINTQILVTYNIKSLTVFAIFLAYHPSNIYAMMVYVAWEHSSFKNVDLVAIQSSDPQA
jgi:hypothetical protein